MQQILRLPLHFGGLVLVVAVAQIVRRSSDSKTLVDKMGKVTGRLDLDSTILSRSSFSSLYFLLFFKIILEFLEMLGAFLISFLVCLSFSSLSSLRRLYLYYYIYIKDLLLFPRSFLTNDPQ